MLVCYKNRFTVETVARSTFSFIYLCKTKSIFVTKFTLVWFLLRENAPDHDGETRNSKNRRHEKKNHSFIVCVM